MGSDRALEELLLQAQKGDAAAFSDFVSLTLQRLSSYVRRMIFDHSSEDIVQESYLRLWKALDSYHAPKPAMAFLFAIAHNVCIDELRNRERIRKVNVLLSGKRIEHHTIEATDPFSDLDLTILTNEQRAAILLVARYGFSYQEASEILDIRVTTLRSRLHEARKILTQNRKLPKEADLETG